VSQNTCDAINEQIRHQTEESIAFYSSQGREAIERRLTELDQEWDIERCVETMASSFTLFGLTLGLTTSRKWLLLPLIVQAFFLQHALQGWCPPIPVLRRLSVRTVQEIDEERYALKALRGDFDIISVPAHRSGSRASAAMEAIHAQ
jgi:hypothetical protein